MLEPIFEQLIPTAELMAVKQITGKAVQARLPGELVHDIEREAAWNPVAKKALQMSAPQAAAKWLNKTGVSAEHQSEVVLAGALLSIVSGHIMLLKRMDELIQKTNPVTVKPGTAPQEKKP